MTTKYVATINVPGYLPMDDEPPVFDRAADAWNYLADERDREIDAVWQEGDAETDDQHVDVTGYTWTEPTPEGEVIAHVLSWVES